MVIQRDVGHHVAYTTREVGQYLVVEASVGIVVIWDKRTSVFIKLAPSYKVCTACPSASPCLCCPRASQARERPAAPAGEPPGKAPGRLVSAGHCVWPVWEL